MSRFGPRGRFTSAAVLIFATGCTGERPSVEAGVERFLELYNEYRISEALDLVAESVTVEIPGDRRLLSKQELNGRMQWDSVLATRFRPSAPVTRGDTTMLARITETSAWLRVLGLASLDREGARFVVKGGLIHEISLGTLTPASRERLERAYAEFLPWAQHEYPERLGRVWPGGRFAYQPRRAADLLSLLQLWRRGDR